MEYSLQACFDLGVSYGLDDKVFVKSTGHVNAPDILQIGIRNPLGLGIRYRVDEHNPEVIAEWRQYARSKVDVPEMELGYDDSLRGDPTTDVEFEAFKQELRNVIEVHPIALCELAIYAIGVVFMRLDFSSGIPVHLLQGVSHCFEYAAYLVPISTALLDVAKRAADMALERRPRKWGRRDVRVGIQGLSKRPDPEIQEDERGTRESRLFTGFTHVAMCVDQGDDVEAIQRQIQPVNEDTNAPDSQRLVFEYHGKMHFNWAGCVLEPKSFNDPAESPKQQIQRMLLCIQIAHTLQAACNAFERLFFYETIDQADGYIKGQQGGRSHVELNRLRTLALAVISLANFTPIAAAEEDQAYFNAYDKNAKLKEIHELILQRSDILLNVQTAEAEEEKTQREQYLNTAVLMLTGFTLLSVLADTYGFLRGEEKWFQEVYYRIELFSVTILMILVTLFFLTKKIRNRRTNTRGR